MLSSQLDRESFQSNALDTQTCRHSSIGEPGPTVTQSLSMSSLSAGLLTKSEEELLQIALGSGGSGSSGGQNQQQKSGYSFQNSSGGDVLKHSGNPGDSDDALLMDGAEELVNLVLEDKEQEILIKEAFQKGVDLKDYARLIGDELADLQEEHVDDYVKHTRELVDLYRDIHSCDSILETMENLLSGFQNDLGKLSDEIQTLQDQSFDMGVRLKNRLLVKQELGLTLDGVVISPEIIKCIVELDVNDTFIHHLNELNRKMNFVKQHSARQSQMKAIREVSPELERLRLKASEKIRAYLLDKIKMLMQPNANIPIIQNHVLLKLNPLNHFLVQRNYEAAVELRLNYLHIMSNYYYSRFGKYVQKMQKLQSVVADKYDLLGLDESARKGFFGTVTKIVPLKDRTSVFSLGDRIQSLVNIDAPVILSHVAEEKQEKYPFEAIFRSVVRTLMDNSSSEYCFASEFFYASRGKKGEESAASVANESFQEIFGRTMKMIQDTIKNYAESSYDALGILLCLRINTQHQLIMQKRRIPSLDSFLNAITLQLWPRFQSILDLHIESVRKISSGSSSISLFSSPEIHPHFITRRYGEFAASILILNDGYNDQLLETSLLRLRNEVEKLIVKLAAEFSDKKRRLMFLINNYDLLVSILDRYEQRSIGGEKQHFAHALEERMLEFVQEELKPTFGFLLSFLTELESQSLDSVSDEKFEKCCQDFAMNWKGGLQTINQSIMQSFANFMSGTMIFHLALKQLIGVYEVFLMKWDKKFPPGTRAAVQPVSLHQISVEIKSKYKPNFVI